MPGLMPQPSAAALDPVSAPPTAPVEQPIDLAHLKRMTFGDRSLQREVLELFGRQADILLARMQEPDAGVVSASAHTLNGSASGIGAFGVARAAQAVELSACADELKPALLRLVVALDAARADIAALLRAH